MHEETLEERRVTAEEFLAWVEARTAIGQSVAAMAREYGVTQTTLRSRLRRCGYDFQRVVRVVPLHRLHRRKQ